MGLEEQSSEWDLYVRCKPTMARDSANICEIYCLCINALILSSVYPHSFGCEKREVSHIGLYDVNESRTWKHNFNLIKSASF